jgi:hypothetical protein
MSFERLNVIFTAEECQFWAGKCHFGRESYFLAGNALLGRKVAFLAGKCHFSVKT